jgi:ubiquinol-cytochrome c reductase cytochrome b subunit
MGTASLGYVLPRGQMSYRAATVITNMLTVIPFVGKDIVYWVWGGFAINNATLARFFSLHYILPFVIAIIAIYHLYQLHKMGSGNEIGIRVDILNKISFLPYFIIKDIFGLVFLFIFYFIFIFFLPETLGHSDNYIMANPLVTPSHIVPEWYFLPFYGILRSILDKTYGIVIMFLSMIVLFFLPILDKNIIRSKSFKLIHRNLFWLFVMNFIFLGYLGSQAPISPYIELGVIASHIHLLYFFLFIPLISLFDYLLNNIFSIYPILSTKNSKTSNCSK